MPSLGTPPADPLPASELVEFSATEVSAISPDFPVDSFVVCLLSSRNFFFQEPELYERDMTIVGWSSPLDKVSWSYGQKLGISRKEQQVGKLIKDTQTYITRNLRARQDVLMRESGIN